MKIRIEKVISQFLDVSRNDCKKILKDGRVFLNGKVILKPVVIDLEKDKLTIDGEKIIYKDKQYFIFNKPSGYVVANYDSKSETIFDIINLDPKRFFAYGRLDKDTEGLLIISNDGKIGHQIMNSKFEIPKKYYFEVDKEFDIKIKSHYPKPITISNNYVVKKYNFEFLNKNCGLITIYEGKFHQVKEMLEFFGYKIIYLKRISIGNLKLDENLELGQLREIDFNEINKIF
ncbi:pseudouridine synthase [Mycoplasmopsis arginini]|uniref:pseudouridine synthase n=1 Tax=Mycoplasmopsis arginini TaxID=2094 RepID=UPI00061D756E|nr:pseudouridine synthase [Mycoplasmopsis arginini]CRH47479.1 ribosomal large subunit pseudouridine synthase B [Chlamydia trachomatis]MCY2903079.1 rRNA pseudouridine synthase [Mycoplasmopsis arginini QMP CG1-2758]MDI3348578.1 rRNA pseudouridine synthase [Mycoplasmopsis arginini]MDI3350134.1 rRNA pseudouridine synthase [Mycoplasmopsis arginini]MDI3351063.1 rRNA pseudouridine synthase [Mycoplasmopsis arginini]